MGSWLQLLSMGCLCGRESVDISHRRFYVLGRLGEGGFSYVDLVEEQRTRKKFAVKRILCHSKQDEAVALAEVDYMKALNHVNLVALEESQLIPKRDSKKTVISEVLVVMPFYRRGTLQNEFERHVNEHISEKRVLRLFRAICEGLKVLHTTTPIPLAHRDMKPANVLLDNDDTPVIMDFGSMGPARVEIKGHSQALVMQDLAAERCSMPYRAPELFNVESYCTIDERVDIWSLGCTLYAMCYHESPFDKAYQRGDSIALAVLAGKITVPEHCIYSREMRDLINSMLVINAMERPFIQEVIQKVDNMTHVLDNRI